MTWVTLRVGKLDAARRQLDTAIRLYFAEGDPVSIHTLAASAYQLLDDIISKRGGPKGVKDLLLKLAKPESRDAVIRKLNEAQNFFKHADRDHNEVLDFRPEATKILLLDACERYSALTGERVPCFDVFRFWFAIGGVGVLFVLPAEQERIRQLARRSFSGASRQTFFQEVLPIASQLRSGAGESDAHGK